MFSYLFILFTLIPVLELIVIIRVGAQIGAINTIVMLILIGTTGAYLAKLQGFQILRNIQQNLEKGILPTEDMLEGFLIFCGGVLLLTPGFITDIIGLLFLIPATRAILKHLCRKWFQYKAAKGETISINPRLQRKKRDYEDFEDANFS